MNTSDKSKFVTRKRVMIGTAAVIASGALLGVGTQNAFADTPNPTFSGTATVSTSAGSSLQASKSIHADLSAMLNGNINAGTAHRLATSVVNDTTVFALLPSSLQKDVIALANAVPAARTADATKIATKALNGEYGSLIENLAKDIRATTTDSTHSLLDGISHHLKLGGSFDDQVARIASTVTVHKDLTSALPEALTADLRTLAKAPATERSADVQKIETTALGGGYGTETKKIAASLATSIDLGR